MSRLGRVLCIEDDADVLTVLSFALRRHGAEAVETATDGVTGIAKARTFQPDLVLCDLMMPGVDGFEVLRRFRSRPEGRAVPVVIFSAIDDPAARARVLERGAQDYWTKGSFDFNRLRERVNELTGTLAPASARSRPN